MAHKKGAGSSNNGRESHSKRLGIKLYGGQDAIAGNIIVRQRGTKHHPDKGVGMGKDHTLYALIDGKVVFRKKADDRSYVSILPGLVTVPEPIHTETSAKLAALAAEPQKEVLAAVVPARSKPPVNAMAAEESPETEVETLPELVPETEEVPATEEVPENGKVPKIESVPEI